MHCQDRVGVTLTRGGEDGGVWLLLLLLILLLLLLLLGILQIILFRRADYHIIASQSRKYQAVQGTSTPTERVISKPGFTLTKRKLLKDVLE